MFSLRKLQSYVLGRSAETEEVCGQLRASYVPVSSADCRSCSDPCDLGMNGVLSDKVFWLYFCFIGHDTYPNQFQVDWETQMLGSVHPYNRQVG